TGYTLQASSGSLAGATSAAFNVAAGSSVIEDFERGLGLYTVTSPGTYATTGTFAAHDGTYGLYLAYDQGWVYRKDAAAQVQQGETLSVWVRLAGGPGGRAYFGFGASATGTLSLVVSTATGQLSLQDNNGYGGGDLATAYQTYLPAHWYRLEV